MLRINKDISLVFCRVLCNKKNDLAQAGLEHDPHFRVLSPSNYLILTG